jgi:hypothetical protein
MTTISPLFLRILSLPGYSWREYESGRVPFLRRDKTRRSSYFILISSGCQDEKEREE